MREVIAFHLEGLAQDGDPIPAPHSTAAYAVVDVD
jgi:predicted RNase H-like HicB family nuclease